MANGWGQGTWGAVGWGGIGNTSFAVTGVAGTKQRHDEFYGHTGNDTINNAAGGKSWIEAGDGNDTVTGGAEQDIIRGQAGNDTINGGAGNDTIDGGAGNDIIEGGSGDDTFSATHLTFGAVDELVGGTGSDSLTIVNTGAADFTAAAAKVSGIETINITSQGSATAATKEVTTVTFQDVAAGQTVIFDGETYTAGSTGATAEQIATSFTSGTAVGGAFTSTYALSTTVASTGASGDQVNFTASATGNATNLTVTGSSQSAEQGAQLLTFATNPGNANNTLAVTVNGTTVTSTAAGGTNAAALTSMLCCNAAVLAAKAAASAAACAASAAAFASMFNCN